MCRLVDVNMVIAGQSPESKYYNENGEGLPFFQGKSDFGQTYPTNRVYCTAPKKLAECGDILLSVRAPVGPTNLTKETIAIGRGLNAIRPLGGILTKHVLYYFKHIEPMLSGQGTGTTFGAVTVDQVKNLDFILPPLAEQHRIVAKIDTLFSKLDKGVETLQTIRQQLKTYRQAVLKWAFEIRENWRICKVSDIGEIRLGRQRTPAKISKDYPTKYIRAANITESGFDLGDVLEMEFTPDERERYYLKHNDIVLSEASGSASQVGKPAIWKEQLPSCCIQNTVIRHRVNNENPEYVYWYYKFLYLSGVFARIVGGVGINHLGAKNFSGITINLAPSEEQTQIVAYIESRLSVCDKLESIVDENLAKAAAIRQSILKKAFSGQLVPQDPDDEPAELLLKRIKAGNPRRSPPDPCGSPPSEKAARTMPLSGKGANAKREVCQ